MSEIFLSCLLVAALVLATVVWARHSAQERREQLRSEGYELIFSLKSYSAWVDCQRDEPFLARHIEELASPGPLTRAREIKDASFPGSSHHMLRLLQAHSRLIEYLWQQSLLRQSQASGWQPLYRDPQYQQIRGAQEELIEEMIGMCQEIIGDRAREWRRTGTDFFSSSVCMSTTTQGPATRV
jgi:hypothetical protein